MIKVRHKNYPKGFTLIEMAVVLMIIALLIGAILKGQQLINASKVKQLESDFTNIPLMIYAYQDKYKAIPGDDKNATNRFSGSSTYVQNGNGDGLINGSGFDLNPVNESYIIWQHLRLAGLMSGEPNLYSNDYMPLNALGKSIHIQSGSENAKTSPTLDGLGHAIRGTYIICSRGIPGELAISLDIHLDDGNPATGSMLITPDVDSFAVGATSATVGTNSPTDISPNNQYIVCLGV
jgi:prepilin-type N-terminal cleavage/methylation domain-containing protein